MKFTVTSEEYARPTRPAPPRTTAICLLTTTAHVRNAGDDDVFQRAGHVMVTGRVSGLKYGNLAV